MYGFCDIRKWESRIDPASHVSRNSDGVCGRVPSGGGKWYGYVTSCRSAAFERRFQLADHVKVAGASLENGLLHVELVREIPEAQKPRQIAITIGGTPSAKVLEASNTQAKAA